MVTSKQRELHGHGHSSLVQALIFDVQHPLEKAQCILIIFFSGLILAILGATFWQMRKYYLKAFVETPVDSHLLDISKCVLHSLREIQAIQPSQSVDNLRVVVDDRGYYEIYLDYSTLEDSSIVSKSIQEVLSPIKDQRYLVSRSDDNISLGFYSPIWWF